MRMPWVIVDLMVGWAGEYCALFESSRLIIRSMLSRICDPGCGTDGEMDARKVIASSGLATGRLVISEKSLTI